MKQVFKDPVKSVEVMERMQLCHDLLSELRKQIRVIEEDFFSLTGEEFGDLQVVGRAGRRELTDDGEIFIPAWRCHCTCGEEIVVSHTDLMSGEVTRCEDDSHNAEVVEL